MQKNNKLKGIVKLVTIKEQDLELGLYVIFLYNEELRIGRTEYVLSNNDLYPIRLIDKGERELTFQHLHSIKTLVVEYCAKDLMDEGELRSLQLPIKQSQWEYAINEIGKEVEFVSQEIETFHDYYGNDHNYKKVAKIIPKKEDKAQERYEKAISIIEEVLGKEIPKQTIIEIPIGTLLRSLKISAGIE